MGIYKGIDCHAGNCVLHQEAMSSLRNVKVAGLIFVRNLALAELFAAFIPILQVESLLPGLVLLVILGR